MSDLRFRLAKIVDSRRLIVAGFFQVSTRSGSFVPMAAAAVDDDVVVTAVDENAPLDGPYVQPTAISVPSGSQRRDPAVRQGGVGQGYGGVGSRPPREGMVQGGPQAMAMGQQPMVGPMGMQQPLEYTPYNQGMQLQQQQQTYGGHNSYGNQASMGVRNGEASGPGFYNVANESFSGAGNADMATDMVPFNSDEYIRTPSGYEDVLSNSWMNSKLPVSPEQQQQWMSSYGEPFTTSLTIYYS